jgi:TPR repeat protein
MSRIPCTIRFALLCCAATGASPLHAANETFLRIACEGADTGAEIAINGVFKGECPLDLQVKPGAIKINAVKHVDATHERVFEQEIRMGEGTAKRIEVTLSESRLTAAAKASDSARIAAAAAAVVRQAEERESAQAALQQRTADELRQLQAAAEARDPASMYKLGHRYEDGFGVPKDRDLALAWYRRAASAGYLPAKGGVGAFAVNGWIGGKPEYALGRELCEPAAAAGVARCMLALVTLYALGEGGLPKDPVLSAEWLERAAGTGLPRAMHRRALQLLADKHDLDQALTLAMRAAQPEPDGHPGELEALATAGFIHAADAPGHTKDERKAFDWFLKAAEAGSGNAMHMLGVMYAKGAPGIPKDQAQAVAWWRKGAANGSASAMGNMGVVYHMGTYGVASNKALAIEWYNKALAAGNERVRPNLNALTK